MFEKRRRTVYFGNFAEDTKGDIIKDNIATWTNEFKTKIDDIYSIGQIGKRGAARFVREEDMWEFLSQRKGDLTFDAFGKQVYASSDSLHDSNPARTKAMRKTVRTLIEANLREGLEAKAGIVTNYVKGRVWLKGDRVAEWDEGGQKMIFKVMYKSFEHRYDELLREANAKLLESE